mgnify:CR=1 FL=1
MMTAPEREALESAPAVGHQRTTRQGQALKALLAAKRPDDIVVATTGYTGRELFTLGDAPNHLYLVGAMGEDRDMDLEKYKESVTNRAAQALALLTA